MTRKKMIMMVIAMCIALSVVVSANATSCDIMSIVSIASTDTSEGGAIWLKNETSAACGNVPAGSNYLFNLPSTNTDRTLAVALTAMSLGKNLWVAFDDSTNPGVIQTLAVQN